MHVHEPEPKLDGVMPEMDRCTENRNEERRKVHNNAEEGLLHMRSASAELAQQLCGPAEDISTRPLTPALGQTCISTFNFQLDSCAANWEQGPRRSAAHWIGEGGVLAKWEGGRRTQRWLASYAIFVTIHCTAVSPKF